MTTCNKMKIELDPRLLANQQKILQYLSRMAEEQQKQKRYIKLMMEESKHFQSDVYENFKVVVSDVQALQEGLEGVQDCVDSMNRKTRSIHRHVNGLRTNFEQLSDSELSRKELNSTHRGPSSSYKGKSSQRSNKGVQLRVRLPRDISPCSHDENYSDSDQYETNPNLLNPNPNPNKGSHGPKDLPRQGLNELNNVKRGVLPGNRLISGQPQQKDFIGVMNKFGMELNPTTIASVSQASNRSNTDAARTVGLHTVLILDTSASMLGQPFNTLKNFVDGMLDNIDISAGEPGLEEHIAIVTCGETTAIVQHFTNDYVKIRQIIEQLPIKGRTPLMTALVLTLCYLELQGECVDIHGLLVPPRVIVVSDFMATSDKTFTGPDTETSEERIKIQKQIFNMSHQFKTRNYPVYCVTVGDSNAAVAHELSENSGGDVIMHSSPEVAGTYYRYQTVVGSVMLQYNLGLEAGREDDIFQLIAQTLPQAGFTQANKPDIERLLQKALTSNVSGMDDLDLEDEAPPQARPLSEDELPELPEWTYMHEMEGISLEERGDLPPIGTRVKRGADWKWKNEDGNGPGTIIGHKEPGLVYMLWDNGKLGVYRCGYKGKENDIEKAFTPRHVKPGEIEVGCCVIRGADWNRNDEDGGIGTVGVVVRKLRDRTVQVRWPSRIVDSYKFGADKWELEVTLDPPHSAGAPVPTQDTSQADHGATGQDRPQIPGEEGTEVVWKWQDTSEQWRLFSEEAIKKMENTYQRNNNGQVMVQHSDKNVKVYLANMNCEVNGELRPIKRETLREIFDGYMCKYCDFKTDSREGIRQHCRELQHPEFEKIKKEEDLSVN